MHTVCINEPKYLSYDWCRTPHQFSVMPGLLLMLHVALEWAEEEYFVQKHALFWNQLWSNNNACHCHFFQLNFEKNNQKDTSPSFDCKLEGTRLFNKNMLMYSLFWHPAPDKQNSTSNKFFYAQTLLCVQGYFINTFWNSLELISISNTFY